MNSRNRRAGRRGSPRNYDLTLSLPGYTGATWIIEGERDGMGTATIEEITRQLPQAVFLPLANVGHFPWHEDPVLFEGRIAEALA